jgi:sulfoquinovose isomerase
VTLQPPPGGPSAEWLRGEAARVIGFARASRHPDGGFGALSDTGRLEPAAARETYVTARMTHVFGLGQLLGLPGCAELVEHGLDALAGPFRDAAHGGWRTALGAGDRAGAGDKAAYTHAFVVLAASTAATAGHRRADPLLAEALAVLDARFWEPGAGLFRDVRSADWSSTEPYRGANANMHAVEALLAASDATGHPSWRARAHGIAARLAGTEARARGWLLPEHYDERWQVMPEHNAADPAHPFRPYGATIGHLLEWSRLCVELAAADPAAADAPELIGWARELFAVAVRTGWAIDGADGFVYTVDWSGRPVVRNRMHWVAAESVAAAAALWRATGEARYAQLHATWWRHIGEVFIDLEHGSWRHELDAANRPASGTWTGKPDAYHAVQAALRPLLPNAPSIAPSLAAAMGAG